MDIVDGENLQPPLPGFTQKDESVWFKVFIGKSQRVIGGTKCSNSVGVVPPVSNKPLQDFDQAMECSRDVVASSYLLSFRVGWSRGFDTDDLVNPLSGRKFSSVAGVWVGRGNATQAVDTVFDAGHC